MNDKIVMPVWTVGLFIVVMNTTMFNVSIPSIIQDLHITADLGAWVISSYSIGYALSTVLYSRLSDVLPIRKLLTVGLIILGLSSVFGLFAREFHTLLAARILQSAGSGVMAGLGLVLASRYIPLERRGSAIAMISAGSAMAFGLGPIVGGFISEYWGWNGLFAITCLVLVILPILLRLLPKEQPVAFRFDICGALLTVVNAASLLLAVTQISGVWLAISALSFGVHVWHLRRASDTFINPLLLANPAYRKLVVIGFCILVLNLGNLFLMPLILAKVFNQSAMTIGLTIAPGAILSAFLTRFVGRWIDRFGNMRFLLIGHGLLTLVMIAFSLLIGASPLVILIGYLCFSPAFSATVSSLNNETSRILPKPLIGSGMGLLQLIQFFGGAMSVAICGILLEIQENTPLLQSYKHVYGLLIVVGVCSVGMLLWYKFSGKTEREVA
ncbi:MFS transporter [Paenibacillus qinlingensis]|uniref:DHA2 family metal-tetracycline-proton antiporter-like MFS transporter n=1 Tax=Paenibacillus qinlingensis TaxID=1837343 RepID=A0ABU1NYZ5_9BACL|nr:MFS transporter [Paenibacillus qinlingensis]MDR6552052.1 DHA2 family metal-tetracycline-proton antiporter-like MFS transporter [Paenibacillus qinlingensis]